MNNIILQQFVSKTDLKQGFSFIVSGNHSQIHTRFNPLKIGKNYEMSLVNHETYYVYSIPNIHTGSYGINDEIQRQLRLNKHKAKIINRCKSGNPKSITNSRQATKKISTLQIAATPSWD